MKKILCFLLTALFVFSAIPASASDVETGELPIIPNSFSDVREDAWYYDYVSSACELGVMQGKGGGLFDPEGSSTRAEFVAVLMRLSGEEAGEVKEEDLPFSDVRPDDWFAPYVAWAVGKGYVNGYPNGTFRPGALISRCETAALIDRFIKGEGIATVPDPDAPDSFRDVPANAWYAADLDAARPSGLMKGDPDGSFRPNDPVTRAEIAAISVRLANVIAEAKEYASPLPVVRIDTETGRDVESKEEYIKTAFSLVAPDGRSISVDEVNIRGRGNTAWRVDKKSYKLKFPSKICLTEGSECDTKAKDWTLIACHFDRSLVRNHIGYRMARAVGGIEWTPYTEMVELYLNGEYRGIYMLAEQVEAKKGRVPVDDGEKEDIGFLLEIDFWSKGQYYVDYFKSMGRKYTIKTDFMYEDQVVAMKSHLETVYNVICEGDREKIESCVDLASAVDMYLLNEVYRETDVGTGSVYLYFKEPHGKLYFGPVWDLDGAFGNNVAQTSTSGMFAGHKISASGSYSGSDGNMWYAALMTNDWFRQLAKERWFEIRDTLLEVLDRELKPIYYNMPTFEKNFEVWDILHTDIGGGAPPKTLRFNSCYENVVYMEEWARERIAWLDSLYGRDDFVGNYAADREKLGITAPGPTDLNPDHTKWTVPDWYERDKIVQMYLDRIYDIPEEYLEDTRIFVTLGARVTMTPENLSKVVLGEYLGIDTERYQFFVNERELESVRNSYGGLGGGQKMIGVLHLGIRDLETGEESTSEEVIFTFKKDLKLNGKFGVD
ncbi:MAG: CotH kinase family protein [Clostridia bacterium]|nr:CotH kinase family protein [Clostridia bacterium]